MSQTTLQLTDVLVEVRAKHYGEEFTAFMLLLVYVDQFPE